jgi:hypothetical protein
MVPARKTEVGNTSASSRTWCFHRGQNKTATKNKNRQSNLLKKMSTHAYKELHTCPIQMH